jgi:hypothetical protein
VPACGIIYVLIAKKALAVRGRIDPTPGCVQLGKEMPIMSVNNAQDVEAEIEAIEIKAGLRR